MRHNVKKVKLGVNKDHTTALMRNLAMSVIIYDKIKTTSAKAKAVQPFVERLIEIAKKGPKLEAIRHIESLLQHEDSSKKIFDVLVEKYKERKGGYTRMVHLGYRSGDNAPVVQLELV
ncbi:50S ribosomal protein L17 [Candidatus Gracilibacteria bacterium]|jgi:ribosomal protein L17|nr:50S ribosomal protein L17 [Candidatus Gracilibacteria bacterium]